MMKYILLSIVVVLLVGVLYAVFSAASVDFGALPAGETDSTADQSADVSVAPDAMTSHSNDGSDAPVLWHSVTLPDSATLEEKTGVCDAVGGKWLDEYRECDLLSSRVDDFSQFCVKVLRGSYDGCASACRHSPDTRVVCIEICVPVCSL